MKITKKTAIIGIAIIFLIGIGSFFLEGAQSEDPSAEVKVEKAAKSEDKADKETKSENKDKKSNATSEKSTNSSSKNNSNSGNKGNSNSSNSSTPSQPAHTHSWVVITESEQEYVGSIEVCTFCQIDITSNYTAHLKQHALNGENAGRYTKPIYETVTKTVGYKCSCGATK